ncbi:hypothetical protein IRJ41_011007 [Triplophysa rosa]|uniref:Transposase domain-containing protein n=1 Tax=Triplophysa rosa TaxID=992332 RepID=A0A9W7TQD9_TRIRA|nr:hypothetical protein IRJ41_011007 [Triplophysa rosa]
MRETKIDLPNQDLPRAHANSDAWIPVSETSSERPSETTEEVNNLNENSPHYDFDNGSEDAHDVSHITVTNDDSEPWVPLNYGRLAKNVSACVQHRKLPRERPNQRPMKQSSQEQLKSFLLILSFVLRHGLTGMALSDLLDLINIHCPENTQLTSKHLFLKKLKPVEGHLQCHIYCPNCEYYIGDQDSEGQCLAEEWKLLYILTNPNSWNIFLKGKILHNVSNQEIARSETYEDIGSGKMYHNLYKIGGPLHCTHGYSLTLNCDGVPVFKSSLYGIWPLYGIVNELPYPVRKENVLLFGLWFGDKKPNVNIFLKPFTLHFVAALMICDSVARPILQNMTQFNGRYGCSLCLHPGEQAEKGHGTVRVCPYKDRGLNQKILRGVKGTTCLIKIPHFDIISGMPPDHMHNVHLGVVCQMVSMWLDSDNHEKPYYIGNRVNELDEQLLLITRFWKASEWQNWLLFYSIFVLKGILPRVFYQHWLVLVTCMYLLCKDIITTEDVKKCEKLVGFFKQFETLYGKTHVSFNVHLCLHLPESVRNWGPLWAHSGYIFESFNGEILKMFHGTQCVPLQIMKQFTYRQILPLLRNDALRNAVPECIQLFSNLTGRKRLKQFERVCDQLVTLGLHYSQKLSSEEILVTRESNFQSPRIQS